jgi:hypothetical protein
MKQLSDMPDDSRVWIYQCNRELNDTEIAQIKEEATKFGDEWTSHGAQMDAAIELLHSRFLIIAANEAKAAASGCGIDKSVRFVKEIGEKFGVDFFNRTTVVYFVEGQITSDPLNAFWAKRKAGIIDGDTLLFDNTIKTSKELKYKWVKTFEKSWHQEMWAR